MPRQPLLIDLNEAGSVEAAELLLDKLRRGLADNLQVDLRVPVHLRRGALGGQVAAMQIVGTWAREAGDRGVVRTLLNDDVSPDELIEHLDQQEHLLFTACVAPHVFTRSRVRDITDDIRAAAKVVLHRRRTSGPRRLMRSVLELVPDDWPQFAPTSLYKRGDARYPLDLKDEYLPLADRIMRLSQTGGESFRNEKTVSSLSWALFELFQNTDQWARSLPSGGGRDKRASPSARAIIARWHSFSVDHVEERVGSSPALLEYLRKSVTEADPQVRFFEISILDMGPGLAGWRASDLSIENSPSIDQEVALIRWSLAKRRTTSQDATKGMGYHRALLNLTNLGGFLQLRTGNVAAFRDFVTTPYPTSREASDAALPEPEKSNWTDITNWVSPDGPRSAPVRRTVGTRVTMLIPDRVDIHA